MAVTYTNSKTKKTTTKVVEKKPTLAEIKRAFDTRERIYKDARKRYNDALALLQDTCEHKTIVGGNERYGDVDWRVCVTCGLYERRGYNDDGDEYNYATRAKFKVMPVPRSWNGKQYQEGTTAYDPATDRSGHATGEEIRKFAKHKE